MSGSMFIGASRNFAKVGAPKSKIISSLKPHSIKIEQFWPVAYLHSAMAATMAKFPLLGYFGGKKQLPKRRDFSIAAQQPQVQESEEKAEEDEERESVRAEKVLGTGGTPLRPVEKQVNVESKNMGREYGGDWLSSATRHVRIYAAYIDPETCAFDQTQMDKLTIILDPTNEFVWTSESCNKVYSYFQELVDHYEGAPLTEYTLRLIGSDIEHYIRKLLYDGEIKYNMDARVLNFSMGKPRMMFNNNDIQPQDVQQS